jgi:hypothetical protein
MHNKSIRLINEPIVVSHAHEPALEKKPGCPDSFTWRDEHYQVARLVSEWHDYRRKGRMARNMQPQHARAAAVRGSWGVGQDYYLVETKNGKYFVIYFDRSPRSVDDRKGMWFIEREYY